MSTMIQTLLKGLLGTCLIAGAALVSSPARAVIGTVDVVPAATILVPYFEVDLNNNNGRQTSVQVTNTSATAMLLNVTLWTDIGIPTFRFNIYQPGYTTTPIDLRMLFKGVVPITASDGQDLVDDISPQGPWSQDINFASCNGTLPYATPLPAATLTALRNAHTGQSSTTFGGSCGGVAYGDGIARGYITIDTVNSCQTQLPGDVGYFLAGGAGTATNQNTLTAQVTYLDRSQNQSSAEPAVHIEANGVDPLTNGAGDNTFYGRFVAFSGADNREPLFGMSQARYFNTPGLSTEMTVWRDPGSIVSPFACGASLPGPYPLGQREFVGFDEQEDFTIFSNSSQAFPYASQTKSVSSFFTSAGGHLFLNLVSSGGDPTISFRQQHYLSVRHRSGNSYSGQTAASQIVNASRPSNENYIIASF